MLEIQNTATNWISICHHFLNDTPYSNIKNIKFIGEKKVNEMCNISTLKTSKVWEKLNKWDIPHLWILRLNIVDEFTSQNSNQNPNQLVLRKLKSWVYNLYDNLKSQYSRESYRRTKLESYTKGCNSYM